MAMPTSIIPPSPPSPPVLPAIPVPHQGVYAEINLSVIRCLQIVDPTTEKTMRRNFAFSLIESLKPSLPLISELDREASMRLAERTSFEWCKAGSLIFKPGDTGSQLFVVLQGCAVETEKTETAPNAPETAYRPGDSFGETAMLTSTPYTTTMVARDNTILMAFDEKALSATLMSTGDKV